MIDPIITSLVSLGIGGCMAALVVWHVWYTQTRQIPDMTKAAREGQAAMLLAFETQLKEERANSDLRAKIDRESNQKLIEAERQITQMRHQENMSQIMLMIQSLRETHHQLNNLGNQVKLHHALVNQIVGIRQQGGDESPEMLPDSMIKPAEKQP